LRFTIWESQKPENHPEVTAETPPADEVTSTALSVAGRWSSEWV
jgi:hypothetical protein